MGHELVWRNDAVGEVPRDVRIAFSISEVFPTWVLPLVSHVIVPDQENVTVPLSPPAWNGTGSHGTS